jgi:hypothetical protein
VPLSLEGFDPISVCVDDNRVFVNVRLSGDAPFGDQAEIIHDHFTVQPSDWDWNFDDQAFEAVDKNQQPVLQLIYRSPSDILVRGVFTSRGAAWLLTDSATYGAYPLTEIDLFRAVPDHQIPRIFKYPSEKYLHVRD